jgi:YfiH family protein
VAERLVWREGGATHPAIRWAAAPGGVTVEFTGRRGGVSEGPYRSLNLGVRTGDARDNVIENRRRAVAGAGGDPERATMAWQVHGTDIREVGAGGGPGRFLDPGHEPFPHGDGLATSVPGTPLVLLTADCLPLAAAAPDGGRVVVAHAGWRGLAGGIGEAGAALAGEGAVAAVGPGAGPCCYAVGEDVASLLRGRFGDDVVRDGRADLWLCAERSLRAGGATRVDVARLCTICDAERFFSHRRDAGVTGRQGVVAFVGA